jgi:hypothetical protein
MQCCMHKSRKQWMQQRLGYGEGWRRCSAPMRWQHVWGDGQTGRAMVQVPQDRRRDRGCRHDCKCNSAPFCSPCLVGAPWWVREAQECVGVHRLLRPLCPRVWPTHQVLGDVQRADVLLSLRLPHRCPPTWQDVQHCAHGAGVHRFWRWRSCRLRCLPVSVHIAAIVRTSAATLREVPLPQPLLRGPVCTSQLKSVELHLDACFTAGNTEPAQPQHRVHFHQKDSAIAQTCECKSSA